MKVPVSCFFECLHEKGAKQASRYDFLVISTGQLHVFKCFLSCAMKALLKDFSDGPWKISELPPLDVFGWWDDELLDADLVSCEELRECEVGNWKLSLFGSSCSELFKAWFMRASQIEAGSWSSITSTFPALRGTIS